MGWSQKELRKNAFSGHSQPGVLKERELGLNLDSYSSAIVLMYWTRSKSMNQLKLCREHTQFIPTVEITPVGNQTLSLSPGGLS